MVPGHLLTRQHGAQALVLAVLLAACTSGRSVGETDSRPDASRASPARSATAAPVQDWPTYHGANDRAGDAPGPSPRLPLQIRWRTSLDGAVYAQPIVARGRVIVATANDTVYALDPATGAVAWRTRLGRPQPLDGLPCGNVDPLGITGTPAYDAATGQVFVVTETVGARHTLVVLDPGTGRVRWRRGLDVLPDRDRRAQQQRAHRELRHVPAPRLTDCQAGPRSRLVQMCPFPESPAGGRLIPRGAHDGHRSTDVSR